jgi:hypothetical protein
VSLMIQYTGFQLKARGREYCYRVVDPKSEPREFTLTISNRLFEDRHVPYQDGAAICYQKLQKELLTENGEPIACRHFTITDEELVTYLTEHRPSRKRSW